MDGPWRVELTSSAVESLRALPPAERAAVAAAIDQLAGGLLPGGLPAAEEGATVVVPAGDHVLLCVRDEGTRRIVVAALRSREELAAAPLGRLAGRALARRLTRWRGGEAMSTFVQDVRFAARSLRRSPGFSLASVLTLALGIGATAAIFSVAHGVLLKPLPYQDPDEVVTLWTSWINFPDKTWVSIPEYQLFHQENRTLEDLAVYGSGSTTFTSPEYPERVGAASVTPNTFDVLGVAPAVGRAFTWEEARNDVSGVLIAHGTWQRRFGGDRGIVGRPVELDGTLTPILGVLPEGFVLPTDYGTSSPSEVFFPMYVDLDSPAPDLGSGGSHGWHGVGRLRPGVTVEEARSDLARIMGTVEPVGLYGPEMRFTPRLFAAKDDIVGSARGTILVLLGAVGFVLLIACGNVANLLLSRSEVRVSEVAVRTALGAGRRRILRQLLTESLVLAGVAGILGFGLATLGVELLLSIDPDAVPRSGSVAVGGAAFLFTMSVSLLTVVLFGAAPAVRMSGMGLGASIREGGRSGRGGTGSHRTQGLLVASQMAMAVILLTGSALMIRTFVRLLEVDPGFHAEDVLTVRLTAPAAAYPDAEAVALFYAQLLERVRAVPGVRSVGAARLLPLASTMGDSFFRPVGYEPGPNESTQGDWQWATPGYLETMGIPLLEGRAFDERDRRDGQPVVMVNEVVARRYWPGESALGRAVVGGGMPDTAVVVGVVGNVSHNGILTEAKTRYYVPHAQVHPDWTGTMRSMTLTIATEGDPGGYLEAVRGEVRSMDPSIPLSEVRTLDEVLSSSVAQPRFAMVLLGAFATVALVLALVGIYGVLAYAVSQRTREIGIRMVLGAEGGQVVGMVVREGMIMALTGVVVGTAAAWFLSGLMAGLLYGVAPRDPATFTVVPALFAAVALVACFVPAARAARVRPASALRHS